MEKILTPLTENELWNVAGGVDLKKLRDMAIIDACTIAGSVAGIASWTCLANEINKKTDHARTLELYGTKTSLMDETAAKRLALGQFVGLSMGATSGLCLGKKIVEHLNKK